MLNKRLRPCFEKQHHNKECSINFCGIIFCNTAMSSNAWVARLYYYFLWRATKYLRTLAPNNPQGIIAKTNKNWLILVGLGGY